MALPCPLLSSPLLSPPSLPPFFLFLCTLPWCTGAAPAVFCSSCSGGGAARSVVRYPLRRRAFGHGEPRASLPPFGGWGWGARASENSSGYGCQDASWTEADPQRRKASPPPLLGQSCFDCLNDGKGASEGRGRCPTATMVGHIRSSRHDIVLRDVCRGDVLIPFLTPAC